MDPEELGFERSGRLYVACVMCGHKGGGVPVVGRAAFIFRDQGQLLHWQRKHLKPHIYLCVCGKAHPTRQALGAHVAQTRRHRIPGHGALDRVGA